MTEEEKQDTQKTVVAFIAGLLIGGLLVWVFGGNGQMDEEMDDNGDDSIEVIDDLNGDDDDASSNTSTDDDDGTASVPVLPTGDGDVAVNNQAAGSVVELNSATFPSDEGWVGVRDYRDGEATGLLGVARFSKEQGLIPTEIELLRATQAGEEYAIVFFSESGDREFDVRDDLPVGGVVETFEAE